jgi:hypothetical protein
VTMCSDGYVPYELLNDGVTKRDIDTGLFFNYEKENRFVGKHKFLFYDLIVSNVLCCITHCKNVIKD